MRPRRYWEKSRTPSKQSEEEEEEEEQHKTRAVGFGIDGRDSLRLIIMSWQSRKWMILVATIWLQAFSGTNFDFSSYSSDLKMVLGVSQVQLNYLAVASDLGKAFGWSSGLAILYLPLWLVLFMAASMGFVGYGLQWLVMRSIISLPYFVVSTTLFFFSSSSSFSPFHFLSLFNVSVVLLFWGFDFSLIFHLGFQAIYNLLYPLRIRFCFFFFLGSLCFLR